MEQFDQFKATLLYCNKCRRAMPVRERLLLVLPDGDLYDYTCEGCTLYDGTCRGYGTCGIYPCRPIP